MKSRLLLILPKFNDLHRDLIAAAEDQFDNVVIVYDDLGYQSYGVKLLEMISLGPIFWKLYYSIKLHGIPQDYFSHCLVIKGGNFRLDYVSKFNIGRRIFYTWDSSERYWPNFNLDYFDAIGSFDKSDCQKFGWSHLPVLLPESDTNNIDFSAKRNTIYYVGSYSQERENILIEIYSILSDLMENTYRVRFGLLFPKLKLKLWKRFIVQLYKVGPINWMIKRQNTQSYFRQLKKSRIVLEICHGNQSAPTQRVYEGLLCGCLVMSNKKFDSLPESLERFVIHLDQPKNIAQLIAKLNYTDLELSRNEIILELSVLFPKNWLAAALNLPQHQNNCVPE